MESAAGPSSDVEHIVEGSGADGCSDMLNQGCWRHSVTVRRSLQNKNRILEERNLFDIFKNEEYIKKNIFFNAIRFDFCQIFT